MAVEVHEFGGGRQVARVAVLENGLRRVVTAPFVEDFLGNAFGAEVGAHLQTIFRNRDLLASRVVPLEVAVLAH